MLLKVLPNEKFLIFPTAKIFNNICVLVSQKKVKRQMWTVEKMTSGQVLHFPRRISLACAAYTLYCLLNCFAARQTRFRKFVLFFVNGGRPVYGQSCIFVTL